MYFAKKPQAKVNFFIKLCCAFLVLGLLAGCVNQQAIQAKKQARQSLQRGDLNAALLYYQQVLKNSPADNEAKEKITFIKVTLAHQANTRGLKLLMQKKLTSAQGAFNRSLSLAPSAETRANLQLVRGKILRADQFYRQAVDLQAKGQWGDALSAIDKAMQINAEEPRYAAEVKKIKNEASEHFREMTEGAIAYGNLELADKHLERAIFFGGKSTFEDLRKRLSSLQKQLSDCRQMQAELSSSRDLALIVRQFKYLRQTKDKVWRLKDCQNWEKTLLALYFRKAEEFEDAGKFGQSRQVLKNILAVAPGYVPAKQALGRISEEFVAEKYREANRQMSAAKWLQAAKSFEQILSQTQEFMDARASLATAVDQLALSFYLRGGQYYHRKLFANSYLCFRMAGMLCAGNYRDSSRAAQKSYKALQKELLLRVGIEPVLSKQSDPFLQAKLGEALATAVARFSHPYVRLVSSNQNADVVVVPAINFITVDHSVSYDKGVYKYFSVERVMNEEYIKLREKKDDLYKQLALADNREARAAILKKIEDFDKKFEDVHIMQQKKIPKQYIYDIKRHKLQIQGELQAAILESATKRRVWGKVYKFKDAITDNEIASRYDIGLKGDPLVLPSQQKYKLEVTRKIFSTKISHDIISYLQNYGLNFWKQASLLEKEPDKGAEAIEAYMKFLLVYQGQEAQKKDQAAAYIKKYPSVILGPAGGGSQQN